MATFGTCDVNYYFDMEKYAKNEKRQKTTENDNFWHEKQREKVYFLRMC